MKLNFKMALLMLLVASCNHESEESVENFISENESLTPLTVQVKDFSLSVEEINDLSTRTTSSVTDYSAVKLITLAFYSDDTEVYKVTQSRDNASAYTTFGNFSCSLPMGNYTMVVLGYGYQEEDVLTLTSPTYASFTSGRVRETFAATQEVNVESNNAINLTVSLNRIISKLEVKSTDNRTAKANSVRVIFSGGSKAFSPTTGLSADNTGFSNALPISMNVGETTSTTSYIFLNSDEQVMDITIQTLDANDNVVFSKVVNNVPLKRNRKTILSGTMYTNDAINSAFQLNTEWVNSNEISF